MLILYGTDIDEYYPELRRQRTRAFHIFPDKQSPVFYIFSPKYRPGRRQSVNPTEYFLLTTRCNLQCDLNGSNTDGSFTVDDSN